jgi:flagellin
MGLRIQNNIDAFNTHRQLQISSSAASSSMEKLSSGFRINRAADDAAGLAISEQMPSATPRTACRWCRRRKAR